MNIYDFKVLDRSLQEVSLEIYRGKVLLIVNSATRCGLTPQSQLLPLSSGKKSKPYFPKRLNQNKQKEWSKSK